MLTFNFYCPVAIFYKFDNAADFMGWNCGQVTFCGDFGSICGGYNIKGKGDELKRTIMLDAGHTYSVTMDFIKIDSWFAWWDVMYSGGRDVAIVVSATLVNNRTVAGYYAEKRVDMTH